MFWRLLEPAGDQMKLSVVVCTRNRHETIGQAVESIARCEFTGFDIHVMDQSTNDLTKEIVDALATQYRSKCEIVYHHLARAGLSAAYNSGIGACSGEIIAFTDDDVIVPADWLKQIEAVFDREADAGLLYGQVMIPKDLEVDVAKGIIVPALTFDKYERLSKKEGFRIFGMGANTAIRRSLLDLVGGFDEALGGGGPLRSSQDFDFAYRTSRFGSVIVLAPDVKVDHYGTRTQEQWPSTAKNYGIGDGAFLAKHIRCGDRGALWMLIKRFIRSWLRQIRANARVQRWNANDYGSHLLVGYRNSKAFAIDKKYRLYQETDRGKMVASEANIVTATRKGG
jgi:glycosyltransferase involved in cell wall biosynthesis